MADLTRLRQAAAANRADRDTRAAELAGLTRQLADARQTLASVRSTGNATAIAEADSRVRALADSRSVAAREMRVADARAHTVLGALLQADVSLEGDAPLVLLPVRVETRSTADATQLRVRIFHDSLHAEVLDEGLSAIEANAGRAFWTSVWATGDTTAAWPALLAAVGARRAEYVADVLRPVNLAARPAGEPEFASVPSRGGAPAAARTLPDRFYVRLEQAGAAPVVVHGRPIPEELPIGLADRDDLTLLQLDDQDLPPIDDRLRWLVDYAEAERVGMAVTITLPRPGVPVARLLVYGVRASLDAEAAAEKLARLVRAHRFTDGASFVAQGTPTNNTDSARAAWSRRASPAPPALTQAPLAATSNAAVCAAALGLSADALGALPGATDDEQGRARAFNTALWTTTWGDAIEHLTPAGRANGDARLDSPSIDAVRDHWVEFVRGRGPVPALRIGRQPYGVLPVVATDASWRPLRGDFVENRLVPFIDQQVRWMWRAAAPATTVTNTPLDAAMPEILGTDAILRGLRVRTALSPDPVLASATALILPDLGADRSGQQVTKTLLLLSGVADDALDDHDLLGAKTRTLALPLVHETDVAFVQGLLTPDPPAMPHKSVLQVLLAHADAVDRHARTSVATPDMRGVLREALATADVGANRDLIAAALETSWSADRIDTRLVEEAAQHVTEVAGRLDRRALADRHPLPALAPATVVQQVAGVEPTVTRLKGEAGLQVFGELFHRTSWSSRVRASLEVIAGIGDLEERSRLLAETLDCCSHRLDAWITAAASRRLSDLRTMGRKGAYLGAYAWLEHIELRVPEPAGEIDGRRVVHDPGDGGFIHAPGLAHAATAGVLRSARLTHRRGDPNSPAMDIDLSSTRVRDALDVLDGMRRGQSLGALLGYRVERRLHERSGGALELDRFVYVLRTLAPLRNGKLTDAGEPVDEALAASDVVDGLRLLEVPAATVVQKLTDGPTDQRYIVPPDRWIGPKAGEAEAVLEAIADLQRTHDAVADLLLAESVFQVVSGNTARAAAALDVLGAGESMPPECEVVRTPRSGFSIQHRVAVVIPDPVPAALEGWNVDTPRARAEPRLDRWAQHAFGPAAAIGIATTSALTLADAALSALDVLYDADGDAVAMSTLARRLRTRLGDIGDDLGPLTKTWEMAGALRELIAGARPLDAGDLGASGDEHAIGRRADGDDIVARASNALVQLAVAIDAPDALAALETFGVRPAPTSPTLPLAPVEEALSRERLLAEAQHRRDAATHALGQVTPSTPLKSRVELASQALSAIFGAGFLALPRVLPPPAGEVDPWAGAVGPGGVRARPGADLRPWLARMGTIRPRTSQFGEAVLIREAAGRRPFLRVAQTPTGAFATWVGLPFPGGKPPMTPLSNLVLDVAGAEAGGTEPDLTQAIAGVLIDEWTEVVPRRLERHDRDDPGAPPTLIDVTTTGIAINANAPGARPPQAILVALSPDGGDWTSDRLVHVLDETMALARMRALTLQQIPFAGRYLPALYFRDWSLQGEPVIDWTKVAVAFEPGNALKYFSVDQ